MTDAATGQLVTVVSVAGAAIWQYLRENRQRRWDLEDRRMAREHVVQVASDLADTVKDNNRSLHEAISENTGKTEQAIKAADAAYSEANDVNKKIEKLGIEHNAIDKMKPR